ncbi:hypothetical protein IW262DRAFT_1302022 [Armillaria fumosa]|nr:hypothetical protein IW262DRAFT_1302022 [Armillaria fumosa]
MSYDNLPHGEPLSLISLIPPQNRSKMFSISHLAIQLQIPLKTSILSVIRKTVKCASRIIHTIKPAPPYNVEYITPLEDVGMAGFVHSRLTTIFEEDVDKAVDSACHSHGILVWRLQENGGNVIAHHICVIHILVMSMSGGTCDDILVHSGSADTIAEAVEVHYIDHLETSKPAKLIIVGQVMANPRLLKLQEVGNFNDHLRRYLETVEHDNKIVSDITHNVEITPT